MPRQQRVLLIGDSILIDGIAASLKSNQRLHVLQVDPDITAVEDCIGAFAPGLILFDANELQADSVVCLLKEHPGIHLVGLDTMASRMLVLSSYQRVAPSMRDLLQVVEDHIQNGVEIEA